jgi:ribosomal protein S18 acetylase RimI-like enzyme
MANYLRGEHHPQKALMPRVMYLAENTEGAVGYIGGHLTERYGCDGELQYLYVGPSHRRSGVASELFRMLIGWFQTQGASRICVDVEPENQAARAFYARHGANPLNPHWLVWDDIRTI